MWFVELIRALAWPMTLIAVSAIFKPEILGVLPEFMRRNIKLEALGFKAEVGAAEKQQDKISLSKVDFIQQDGMRPNERLASKPIEDRLKADLVSVDSTMREAVLLRELANARLISGYEFMYNRIFGSQIVLIKRLNELGSVKAGFALDLYKSYAEKHPELYNTYTFDQWISFMMSNNMIERTEDQLRISIFGKDFLIYLAEAALTENKPW